MSSSKIENTGEFHPHPPKAEPLRSPKHKPGVKASPSDNAPEFSAKTAPIGTAPPDKTYQPNPIHEIPGQALNPDVERSHVRTTASSTLGGATSADVNKGLGRPLEGELGVELRHDGQHHRKRDGAGFEGVGANPPGVETDLRRLQRDDNIPPGASAQKKGIPAEQRYPEEPEHVAADMNQRHYDNKQHENIKK